MHSLRLLAVGVLALTFFASLTQLPIAHASVEIAYDNGNPGGSWFLSAGYSVGVQFSLQPGWTLGAKLLTARYYFDTVGCSFVVLVLDSDHSTPLTPPFWATPTAPGNNFFSWFDVDLSSLNIVVTRGFFIGIQQLCNPPILAEDSVANVGRSYLGTSPSAWVTAGSGNSMIRAVVDPITPSAPVAGVVMPANNFAIVAPWLAIVGLVGIGTVVVMARKRET